MKSYYSIALRAYCYRILDRILDEHDIADTEYWSLPQAWHVTDWRYYNIDTGNLLCREIARISDLISDYLCYEEQQRNALLAQLFWTTNENFTPFRITDNNLKSQTMLPADPNTAKLAYCYLMAKDYVPEHEKTNMTLSDLMFNRYLDNLQKHAVTTPLFQT